MFNLLPTGRLPGPGRGVCRGDDELGRGAEALQRQRGKPHPVQLGRGAGTDLYAMFDIVWNGKYITPLPASAHAYKCLLLIEMCSSRRRCY